MIDARDFRTVAVIFVWLSDDRCRLPVKIQSVMAILGNGIMTLQTATTPNCRYASTR